MNCNWIRSHVFCKTMSGSSAGLGDLFSPVNIESAGWRNVIVVGPRQSAGNFSDARQCDNKRHCRRSAQRSKRIKMCGGAPRYFAEPINTVTNYGLVIGNPDLSSHSHLSERRFRFYNSCGSFHSKTLKPYTIPIIVLWLLPRV